MIGRTLDHYRIESKLGQGGMGVVYKARDTHLDRPVAIKVLPPDKVADPTRKQRFVQEAKAASALNHPNIVTIYDIRSEGGVDFIVMEYIEGQTLDALIAAKGLRAALSLRYAVQVADGLAKAHGAGILHRDLKPANVMVTDGDRVKILDFGLAKLMEPAESSPDGTTVTAGPMTEEGAVMGTAAYMSPEQAEGRKLDGRSDIFSFGSMLYEMVTSRKPFTGDSQLAMLTKILNEDPTPPSQLAASIPPELEKIILRCLRKDAARRYQTMADLKVALEDIEEERRFQHMGDLKIALLDLKEETESGKVSAPPITRRRLPVAAIAAGLVLLAVTAGITWWLARPKPTTTQIPTPTPLTFDSGVTFMPAISRDGKLLAYSSDRADGQNADIWLQQMAGGQPVRLTRHEAADLDPDFSPDGTRIAFGREGSGIYAIPTLGGEEERKIADRGSAPRFSPDGKWIAYQSTASGMGIKVFIVPSTGGQPRQLFTEFESAGHPPLWSPDGQRILVGSFHPTQPPSVPPWDWWSAPIGGGPAVRTGIYKRLRERGVRITTPGDWVGDFFYLSGGPTNELQNVWRVPLSSQTFQAAGDPQRITSGTAREDWVRVTAGGSLIFAAANISINLWSLPLDANQAKVTGKMEQLTRDAGYGTENYLSEDGKKLLYSSERSGNPDIWLYDLESRKTTALVANPQRDIPRKITADGAGMIYGLMENEKRVVYRVGFTGGTPQKLCEDCCLFDVSADDTKILGCMSITQRPAGGFLDVATGQKTELWKPPKYVLTHFNLSPDDTWVAFRADMGRDRGRLFVMPLRPGQPPAEEKDWIAITDGSSNDASPRWSPDGRLLYFISERDNHPCIWARRLHPSTKQPLGDAFPVHHLHTSSQRVWFFTMISVALDKIALRLGDTRSNIWMVKLP